MTSTSVKYFHGELPGAPVLSGTAGSLIAVLDACLVNGWGLLTAQSASVSGGVCTLGFATGHAFDVDTVALVAGAAVAEINGEQRISAAGTNLVRFPAPGVADGPVGGTITIKIAPAGWEKVYSGANKAAYRSLSPSASGACLRIDHGAARYARMRVYSTMTDIDAGTDPTPTDAQLPGGGYIPVSSSADATPRKWMVAASDRFVHIMPAHSATYPSDYGLCAAGDYPSLKAGDAYPVLIVADVSDTSSGGSPGYNNALNLAASSAGAWLMRPYTQIGGALGAYLYKPGFTSSSPSGSTGHPPGPNPINNSIEVCPTLVVEGPSPQGNRRGEVPGLYGIPHYLGSSFDTKDRITPAVGLPGHTLIAVRYYGNQTLAQSFRFALDITGPWE